MEEETYVWRLEDQPGGVWPKREVPEEIVENGTGVCEGCGAPLDDDYFCERCD